MTLPNPLDGLRRKSETYIIAGVVAIGIAILGLYVFLSFSNYQSIVAVELESHAAILERAAVELDGFIDTRFLLLQELAAGVELNLYSPGGREEKSSLFLHHYPEFQKIRILNATGHDLTVSSRLLTLGREDLKEAGDEPAFKEALLGRPYIGRARVGSNAIPSTELAVPITNELGKMQGAIIADLDLRKIWDTVSQIKVGPRGVIYVVDSEGSLLAHPDRQFALTVADLKDRTVIKQILQKEQGFPVKFFSGEYLNERGEKVFALARPLPYGWGVVVEESKQEFFQTSNSILILNIIVAGITALLIFLLILGARSFLLLFRELKKERAEKAEIIANLSDGLVVTDGRGRVILINTRAQELLLLKEDITSSVIRQDADRPSWGLLTKIFFPPNAPQGIFKTIVPRLEIKIDVPVELYLEMDTVVLLRGEEERDSRILFVLHDVTRERILSRLKSEFISIAAHQLRTPLSAIKWALRLILDGDFGAVGGEQHQYLQSAYETNERMIKLVNDLLNVSRIEEGRFELVFKEEGLAPLVETVVASFKDISAEKHIELIFSKPSKPLPAIRLDRQKMEMVFQNLIENALAYTPEGGTVRVKIEEAGEKVLVRVEDSGIGIPPEEKKRLFTKFHRSQEAIRMQPGGSGLGLFISRNIMVGHRGSIEVESKVGKGSVFTVELPKNISDLPGTGEVEFGEFLKAI